MTEIITSDQRMRELIQLAKTVAPSKATVLIQGESGTGKELVAQLIHSNSSRSNRPYIAINCAAIPESLLESELFGYERGAFTGAVAAKIGKFELAHGGTLLLDEISEMDFRLQAKLLRVLQEGEVDKIGGRRPISVDVRIIATTNCSLAESVKSGKFREDLYYRLNVVNLTLPPLRERAGDVRILADYFMKLYSQKNSKNIQGFLHEAITLLEAHRWPGNIRELENVIERAVITTHSLWISPTEIHMDRNNSNVSSQLTDSNNSEQSELEIESSSSWIPGRTLNDIERNVILEALKYHHGNRTHTAKALGISIRTLRNKLAEYRMIGIYA